MQEPVQALCWTYVVAVLRNELMGFLGACTALTQKEIVLCLDKIKQEPENPPQKRRNGPRLQQNHGRPRVLVASKLREPTAENVETAHACGKTRPGAGSCGFRGANAGAETVDTVHGITGNTGMHGLLQCPSSTRTARLRVFSCRSSQRQSSRAVVSTESAGRPLRTGPSCFLSASLGRLGSRPLACTAGQPHLAHAPPPTWCVGQRRLRCVWGDAWCRQTLQARAVCTMQAAPGQGSADA